MAQFPATYFAGSTSLNTPSAPTAPASTSAFAMQGLAALLTPNTPAGNVLVIIQATLTSGATTVSNGINLNGYYGAMQSGVAAPANAAAVPASAIQIGTTLSWATGVTLTTAASSKIPVTFVGMARGLTPSQQYWFDLAAESVNAASQCGLTNITITLAEI